MYQVNHRYSLACFPLQRRNQNDPIYGHLRADVQHGVLLIFEALFFFMLGVIKKPYFTYLSQVIALGLWGISNINTQMFGGILSMLQIFIDSTLQKWKTGCFPHYCVITQMLFPDIMFDLVFLFFFNTFVHPVIINLFFRCRKYFIKSVF